MRMAGKLETSSLCVLLANGELPAAQVLKIVAARIVAVAAASGKLDEAKEQEPREGEECKGTSSLLSGAALSMHDGFLTGALAAEPVENGLAAPTRITDGLIESPRIRVQHVHLDLTK